MTFHLTMHRTQTSISIVSSMTPFKITPIFTIQTTRTQSLNVPNIQKKTLDASHTIHVIRLLRKIYLQDPLVLGERHLQTILIAEFEVKACQ